MRRESEEKFAKAFRCSPQPFTLSTLKEDRYIEVNDAFEEKTGYLREEVIGRTVEELRIWENYEERGKLVELILRGEPIRNVECRFRKKTGEIFIGLLSAELIEIAGEMCVVANVIDITDWKRTEEALRAAEWNIALSKVTEEALRQSEQRFRLMGEAVPFGVWMGDVKGQIVYLSRQILDLFGLSLEQVRRSGWMTRIPREDVQPAKRHWMHCVRTGEDWEHEFHIRGANGIQYTILSRGKAVRDSQRRVVGWAGVNIDITDRERMEQALNRSERLASVASIAMAMAHEINNPLMGTMNALFLAKSHPELSESIRPYLEMADVELTRVEHITQQTFAFYTASTARTDTSVCDLLDSVADLLETKLHDKHVTLVRRYKVCPHIMAIAGELRQVFSALLNNSLDAVEDYGTIKVRVSCSRRAHHASVRVTIADNGKGITATALPHIFEAFYTTKESVKTGFGLWVSKEIVEKHLGAISVHSRTTGAHRGTTFLIVLPAEPTKATQHALSATA